MSSEELLPSGLDNKSVLNPSENLSSGNQNLKGGDERENISDAEHNKLDNSDHEETDFNDYDVDVMTSSYGEISYYQDAFKEDISASENRNSQGISKPSDMHSLHSELSGSHPLMREKKRPDSLVLKNSALTQGGAKVKVVENSESSKKINKSQQTSDSRAASANGSPSYSSEDYAIYSPGHHRTDSDTSGLSDLQGTITVEGDMVSFVAEDLQEKIRLSSPLSKWTDSPSYPGSHCSTPSIYKQALQTQVPLIDAGAISDLEIYAKQVATCVDTMLENLSGTLQSISSLTVDYMESYENAVCKTCDSVDVSIKTMYQLIAKCEELSNTIKPLYKVSQEIKDIKKALTQFESAMDHKSFGRI